jgi:hypothetical protein
MLDGFNDQPYFSTYLTMNSGMKRMKERNKVKRLCQVQRSWFKYLMIE